MRNFIAVSFVTLLLVLGSSQDPRTRFTSLNLSPMDWDPSTAIIPPTEQVEICSADDGVATDDQGTTTKNLVSGQCLNVTSPNHPGNYPNSGQGYYLCTMVITIPPSQGMTLKLLADSFEFERKVASAFGMRCLFDFLKLENILTADDDDVAGNDRFCGTLTNDKALDSKPEVDSVTLKFQANSSNNFIGFLATLCVP